MHLRWTQQGEDYFAKRSDGTLALVHTPISSKTQAGALAYIPSNALNGAAAELSRIWYSMISYREAPRGGFRTIFYLRDERLAEINTFPAPDCTHLLIESDLDGFVIKEAYVPCKAACLVMIEDWPRL